MYRYTRILGHIKTSLSRYLEIGVTQHAVQLRYRLIFLADLGLELLERALEFIIRLLCGPNENQNNGTRKPAQYILMSVTAKLNHYLLLLHGVLDLIAVLVEGRIFHRRNGRQSDQAHALCKLQRAQRLLGTAFGGRYVHKHERLAVATCARSDT